MNPILAAVCGAHLCALIFGTPTNITWQGFDIAGRSVKLDSVRTHSMGLEPDPQEETDRAAKIVADLVANKAVVCIGQYRNHGVFFGDCFVNGPAGEVIDIGDQLRQRGY